MEHSTAIQMKPIKGVKVPPRIYTDRNAYMDVVREGVPGYVVKQTVDVLGIRELFLNLFDVDPGNFSRLYRKKHLSRAQSEAVLDTVRLFSLANAAFKDPDKVKDWMNSPIPILKMKKPIDLCDTFEGRDMVEDLLLAIYYGDFS